MACDLDTSRDNQLMGIVLLGYRGSGKTTVGMKLADRLWWDFVDTDQRIVERTGKSIKTIFEQDGESVFREIESDVLEETLRKESTVISCGGGIILKEKNRELLKQSPHSRVYLSADPEVLYERIRGDQSTAEMRPSLTALGGGVEEVRALLQVRQPLYREVMTVELDVTHLSVDEVVVRVAKLV